MTKKIKILTAIGIAAISVTIVAIVGSILLWQFFWKNAVSLNQARDIALQHAGINLDQAAQLTTERSVEDGQTVYEISFRKGSTRYEYVIDARKGTVLQANEDMHPASGGVTISENLTTEQIKQIVLRHAKKQEDDVTRMSIEPDYEGGMPVFEVEFYCGQTEYEYTINAITGTILSAETQQ